MKIAFLYYLQIGLLPLILTNVLHMIIVKMDLFTMLKKPIWANGFGDNKTWRGVFVIVLLNMMFVYLISFSLKLEVEHPFLIGFVLGMCYVLLELPNSYLKRRLGIASGESHPKHKSLFAMIDKTDSAFGVALGYWLLGHAGIGFAIVIFLFNGMIHAILSFVLVKFGLKRHF